MVLSDDMTKNKTQNMFWKVERHSFPTSYYLLESFYEGFRIFDQKSAHKEYVSTGGFKALLPGHSKKNNDFRMDFENSEIWDFLWEKT